MAIRKVKIGGQGKKRSAMTHRMSSIEIKATAWRAERHQAKQQLTQYLGSRDLVAAEISEQVFEALAGGSL